MELYTVKKVESFIKDKYLEKLSECSPNGILEL